MLEWLGISLSACVSLFWLYIAVRTIRSPFLPREISPSNFPTDDQVLISVVVPFRDEEDSLRQTLEKISLQSYRNLEIVVINDRSTDRSGEILEDFSKRDARIIPIHVKELPPDWLGKTHAMQKGFEASKGEYILFMDADLQLAPQAIETAVSFAQINLLDHLSVSPIPICQNLIERIVYSGMWVLFALYIQIWKVNAPRSSVGAGVGAFNFVRRSSLAAIGGFQSLRMEIVDDMGLAFLLRKAGNRSCFAYGGKLLSIRYQDGIWGLVKGIEKNAFAAADFQWRRALFTAFVLLAISWPPYLLVMFSTGALEVLLGWSGMLSMIIFSFQIRYFPTWWGVIFFPFVCSIMAFATIRSAILTTRRGGVLWRDTIYSTDQLKKGKVYHHSFYKFGD